jgi:sugar lactone lactonase YvrE
MRIASDGSQELVAQTVDTRFGDSGSVERYTMQGTLPNGLAFARNGDILIANFGTDAIERMTRDGVSTTLYTELDGEPLGKTNFVLVDSHERVWFTVTTRLQPWTRSINEHAADGYVGLIDEAGIRIVADGFVGTNEIRFDEDEEWLYVVESNARRISRLRAHDDGSLTGREIYGPADLEGVPDGFAFDAGGNLWITFVNADRLVALTPEGDLLTLLDDGDPERVANWDRHFFAGTMTPEILSSARGTIAPMMASVTFGGPDLRTVYIGSLMGTTIPYFRSPVPGLPLPHWR